MTNKNKYEDNITRYCGLITKINEKVAYIKKEESDFYDGGHSFEEVYKTDLKELEQMKREFSALLKVFTRPETYN